MRIITSAAELQSLEAGTVIGYLNKTQNSPIALAELRDGWVLLRSRHRLGAAHAALGAAAPDESIVVLFDAGNYRAMREELARQEALPTEAIIIRGTN